AQGLHRRGLVEAPDGRPRQSAAGGNRPAVPAGQSPAAHRVGAARQSRTVCRDRAERAGTEFCAAVGTLAVASRAVAPGRAARWGHHARLELNSSGATLAFHGQLAELTPHLETAGSELVFTHRLKLPGGECHPLDQAQFFAGPPSLALFGHTFYLLRDPPPHDLLIHWAQRPSLPVKKLSHRLLTHLRKNGSSKGADWEQLCVAHTAVPRFIFELSDDSVRLRLLAESERDQTVWQWNGHEWQLTGSVKRQAEKPEILDDPRLEPAAQWLRRLDWFTPEPGLW